MPLSAPTKFSVPFNNSGVNRTTIPVASQIGVTPGRASYTDGFPPLTMTPISSGGVPPFGQDFNGIFFAVTQAIQWLQSGSGYAFDSTFATAVGGYPQWAMVQRSDGKGYWLNTVANNSTNPESATNSGWIPAASNASSAITMTSSNVTLTALQAGAYIITLSGALTANLQLIFPNWANEWLVVNNCTGNFSVTCKTASGTGVAISTGSNAIVYGDGTNINYYSGSAAQTFNVANATQSQHAVALGQFGSSLAASGYQKLPSGLIIQWGSATANSSGVATISHPIAFTSSVIFRMACVTNATGSNTAYNFAVGLNGSQSLLQSVFQCSAAVSNVTLNWLAIGY